MTSIETAVQGTEARGTPAPGAGPADRAPAAPAGRVLYVQYTNPAAYPPIEHSAHLLADAGSEVTLLGTRRSDDPLEIAGHERIDVSLRSFEPGGWRQKIHYLRFVIWVLMRAARWRPAWVYASDPLACPAALIVQRILGVPLVYHEHDSPSVQGRSPFMRLVLGARRRVARSARLCVLPGAERADAFRVATGRQDVLTVWNTPSLREVSAARRPAVPGRLRVLYHGSIVPARLPPSVIEALACVPDGVTLDVIGYDTVGHRGYSAHLEELAGRLGVRSRVRFHGPVPRATLMRMCPQFDVGLALLPRSPADLNERHMVGASNKPFDYMAGGLALLVADLPDWHATFVDPGFGLACDPASPDGLAGALRWLFEHPEARARMGEQGRQRILNDWNYEAQFGHVLAAMRRPRVTSAVQQAGRGPA